MTLDHILAQITRNRWDGMPPYRKLGTPAAGDAKILRYTTDRGSVLTPVEVVDRLRLFPLGALVATPALVSAVAAFGADAVIARLVSRHAGGDWGDLTSEDHRANDVGLVTGGRLLSVYTVGNPRIWIITEADRSATTLLLPSDY